MAKPIYMPDDMIEKILLEIREQITKSKNFGGIKLERTFSGDNRTAVLWFSPTAWVKMTTLVTDYGTEVQWHGLCHRISESEFLVYDILVFPHTVSAATVVSDQTKYSEWINGLADEQFNDLRFHGHSHVNMGTTPSGVDMKYRKDVVTQLPKPTETEDSFYIFLILNKKGEFTAEIYDLKYNAVYDTDEIDVDVMLDGDETISTFMSEAKSLAVEESKVATAPAYQSNLYPNLYNTYQGASAKPYHAEEKKEKKSEAKRNATYRNETYGKYSDFYGYKNDWDDDEENPNSPFYIGRCY